MREDTKIGIGSQLNIHNQLFENAVAVLVLNRCRLRLLVGALLLFVYGYSSFKFRPISCIQVQLITDS